MTQNLCKNCMGKVKSKHNLEAQKCVSYGILANVFAYDSMLKSKYFKLLKKKSADRGLKLYQPKQMFLMVEQQNRVSPNITGLEYQYH